MSIMVTMEENTGVILLTGFEPFGSSDINPSAMLVRGFEGSSIEGYRVETAVVLVEAARTPATLLAEIERTRPQAVLMLGLAGGRAQIAVERIGINVLDFTTPDNAGAVIQDEPIIPEGPAAYFATIPVRAIVDAWHAAGIPGYVSNTAGAYMCNQVLYTALHHADRFGYVAGFIHVPALPEQTLKEPQAPSMPLEFMRQAVEIALTLVAHTIRVTAPAEAVAMR
jgi:pyroglutamyl-peptidase